MKNSFRICYHHSYSIQRYSKLSLLPKPLQSIVREVVVKVLINEFVEETIRRLFKVIAVVVNEGETIIGCCDK